MMYSMLCYRRVRQLHIVHVRWRFGLMTKREWAELSKSAEQALIFLKDPDSLSIRVCTLMRLKNEYLSTFRITSYIKQSITVLFRMNCRHLSSVHFLFFPYLTMREDARDFTPLKVINQT